MKLDFFSLNGFIKVSSICRCVATVELDLLFVKKRENKANWQGGGGAYIDTIFVQIS